MTTAYDDRDRHQEDTTIQDEAYLAFERAVRRLAAVTDRELVDEIRECAADVFVEVDRWRRLPG